MKSEIKKFKFKSEVPFQIEIVPLEILVNSSKEHLIFPHRTNFYHAFLFEDCSPTHFVDFNPIKIHPYSLLFIDKFRVHQFDQLLKYKGNLLIFTDDFFCTSERDMKFLRSTILFNDLTNKPNFNLDNMVFQRFSELYKEINEELKMPLDESKHDLLKNITHNFLLLADREKRKQGYSKLKKGPDLNFTLLFKDLLEENYLAIKHVSNYAQKLNISEKRLGQATTKILGKNPKEIIDDRIVLEAKRLLTHGDQSIKEIGFQLGFEEPTNFIKYFRKKTTKTPVEFRKNLMT